MTTRLAPAASWKLSTTLALSVLIIVAAAFRFLHLASVPAGLSNGELTIATTVANLIHHGRTPAFDARSDYAPLFTWLEAFAVTLFGTAIWTLRVIPALLGVGTVVAIWSAARHWLGARAGWAAGWLVAVSPWAITLSRLVTPVSLVCLLTALVLWLGPLASRRRGASAVGLGLVIGALLLCGPLGWIVTAMAGIGALTSLFNRHRPPHWSRAMLGGVSFAAAGGIIMIYLLARNSSPLAGFIGFTGLPHSLGEIATTAGHVALMFVASGDISSAHNVDAAPVFNIFTGLMLITGIVVSFSRIEKLNYQRLLAAFVILLIPTLISTSTAPNEIRAGTALPAAFMLVGLGVEYLMETWYKTFPRNAAARLVARLTVGMLITLAAVQGYIQFFHTWAGSPDVAASYNAGTVAALANAKRVPGSMLSLPATDMPLANYLGDSGLTFVASDNLGASHTATRRTYLFTSAVEKDAMTALRKNDPGGTVTVVGSPLTGAGYYYRYEVGK